MNVEPRGSSRNGIKWNCFSYGVYCSPQNRQAWGDIFSWILPLFPIVADKFSVGSPLTNDSREGEFSGTIFDSLDLFFPPDGSSDSVPSGTLGWLSADKGIKS